MADNLNYRGPPDTTKVNVHETWELDYWAKKWGVTHQQIKDAVARVGVSSAAVARHLGK